MLAMCLRLVALFAVMGLGYLIYEYLGLRWFYVFIFAVIALRIHLELEWVERHSREIEENDARERNQENPFRKR